MKQIEKNIYQRGECSFQVKMMLAGNSVNETFDSLLEARAFRDQKSVCRAIDPDAKKIFASRVKKADVKAQTLKKILKQYTAEILPGKAKTTQAIEAVYIRRIEDAPIANQSIFHISREDIRTFVHGLTRCQEGKTKGQALANTSKRHYAELLCHVFNTAINDWGHQLTNPVRMAEAPKPGKPRRRRLEGDEEQRLLREIRASRSTLLLSFFQMAVETGSRKSELLDLDWKDVKMEADYGSAVLWDTKNGTDRIVPLSAVCVDILSRMNRPVSGNGEVFPASSMRTAWELACKRANIDDLHVHDLRHEAISRLFELGFNVLEVASVSGHKTLSILQDYTHLHPQRLAQKINRAKLLAA